MNWVVRFLMCFARPFALGHIHAEDGSLYMERFQLFAFKYFAARLHHIVRADSDRHMHDHPWDFVTVVLQGGYCESRPYDDVTPFWIGDQECTSSRWRMRGGVAFRRATDRHQITAVGRDTWTLFITGPYKNKWGFFTPAGKVPYREYLGL